MIAKDRWIGAPAARCEISGSAAIDYHRPTERPIHFFRGLMCGYFRRFRIEMVPGLEILSGFLGTTSALAEAILNYRGSDRLRPGQKTDHLPGAGSNRRQ
jgi:hypothetical protein